eukprot:comp12215_c0_seq1/m.15822 comp12215_c0_seq1/g.15822  ORF comp12215_c0_seq1/g.15822 comp12215_c0_seq1/m.15822 type:complete len:196 (-) comp12215_c0_seq1:25-612(-)
MAARLLSLERPVIFLLCDIQERFRPLIHNFSTVVNNAGRLVRISNALGLRTIATEQYPKALGKTVDELAGVMGEKPDKNLTVEKKLFSMLVPEVQSQIPDNAQCVLFGIEAHVCILQTALELVSRNIECHLVVDAVSSQNVSDRAIALERLKQAGVIFTSTESVGFQLVRGADHPVFKAISNIAKEPRDPNVLSA